MGRRAETAPSVRAQNRQSAQIFIEPLGIFRAMPFTGAAAIPPVGAHA